MALGKKTGGRKKGSVNKRTEYLKSAAREFDPFEKMRRLADDDIVCRTCRGRGRTVYQARGKKTGERVCESCFGDGKDRVPLELQGKMAAELAQYQSPKLKAIEHSGPGGGPIEIEHDLSMLTEEELALARALALKASKKKDGKED
jgi:hypothetical protein